jgi:hypothetical protein
LIANIFNGSIDPSISEVLAETRKMKFSKLKFFTTTIWSLILMLFYCVDIATDINLLIDYATNEMWGYFILTLIFILLPFLVIWIGFGSDWMKDESFCFVFLTILFSPNFIITA